MRILLVIGISATLSLAAATAYGTVFLYEDFETGLDGWTYNGFWHAEDHRSYDGDWSLAYNSGGPSYNYWTPPFGNSGIAWSSEIDVSGASSVFLEFGSWLQTENGPQWTYYYYDTAHVRIYDTDFNYAFTIQPDMNYFAHEEWIHRETSDFKPLLDSHGLSQFRVGFYFDTVDGGFNEFEGWYVDDVLVRDGDGGGETPPVPEPSTWLLLSTGLVGAVPLVRRRLRRS